MKTDIFKAIQEALNDSPDIKYIDLLKGDIKTQSQDLPFPLPAVLVSFPESTVEHAVNGRMEQSTTIEVLLVLDEITESFTGAQTQEANLNRYELSYDIINRLVFLEGDCFSEIHFAGEREDFVQAQTHLTLLFTTEYEFKSTPYVSRL